MTQRNFAQGLGLAIALAVAAPLTVAAQNRFHGLDSNRDGVVTRAEWRGNDQSFRNQDRNQDGVLSGVELRGLASPRVNDGKNKQKAKAARPRSKPAKVKPGLGGRGGRGGGHGKRGGY